MNKPKTEPEYTGVKMDKTLYAQAKKRAKQRHQSYSDYVRQLIVRDLDNEPVGASK